MRKYSWGILIMSLIISLASCKKKQEMKGTVVPLQSEKERVETVLAQEPLFDTFQSKIQATLNKGTKSISVNGTFKLVRDKRLQISIQPFLGIEVLRAEFTNDSIKMLDRINKRYMAESIGTYKKSLPVDICFETLQALFINRLFIPGKPDFTPLDFNEFKWRTENDGLLIGRLKEDDFFVLNFFLNRENVLSQTRVSNKKNTHAMDWNYSEFQPLRESVFPMKSTIDYQSKGHKLNVELIYSRIELDKNINTQFEIPNSYRKIELMDLVKGLIP